MKFKCPFENATFDINSEIQDPMKNNKNKDSLKI